MPEAQQRLTKDVAGRLAVRSKSNTEGTVAPLSNPEPVLDLIVALQFANRQQTTLEGHEQRL